MQAEQTTRHLLGVILGSLLLTAALGGDVLLDVASTSTLALLSDAATGHGVAGAESVDWTSNALQGENDIRDGNGLALDLGCLKEDGAVAENGGEVVLKGGTGLIVDSGRDTLDTTTASETLDITLSDALDRLLDDLAVSAVGSATGANMLCDSLASNGVASTVWDSSSGLAWHIVGFSWIGLRR